MIDTYKLDRVKLELLMAKNNIPHTRALVQRANLSGRTFYEALKSGASTRTLCKLAAALNVKTRDLIDED